LRHRRVYPRRVGSLPALTSWEAIYRTLVAAFPSDRYHRGATLTDFGNRDGVVRLGAGLCRAIQATQVYTEYNSNYARSFSLSSPSIRTRSGLNSRTGCSR
jgi:hypothetical protein